jgi:phosphatidylinositol glycan class W
MTQYKTDKEGFVSGMTGSSITHINLVSLVALVRPPNAFRLHIIA